MKYIVCVQLVVNVLICTQLFAQESEPETTAAAESISPDKLPWESIQDKPAVKVVPGQLPNNIPTLWKQKIEPGKLSGAVATALKNARQDVVERLGVRFKQYQIAKGLSVDHYIKASDKPDVDLSRFLHGADERGVRLREDMLVCEVDHSIMLQVAVALFKSWAEKHVSQESDKVDLLQLRDFVNKKQLRTIYECGAAAVSSELVTEDYRDRQKIIINALASKRPQWVADTLEATGEAKVDFANPDKKKARDEAYSKALEAAREKLRTNLMELQVSDERRVKDVASGAEGEQLRMLYHYDKSSFIKQNDSLENSDTLKVVLRCELKPLWNLIFDQRIAGLEKPEKPVMEEKKGE